MDRTDAPPFARAQSQSQLSPVLAWALAAAVLLRVVTAVMDREGAEQGSGLIRWLPREKAASLAQTSGKPILYDFTAAWCGPCKQLDLDWDDAAIADRVHRSFVPARVVDRQREDGRNPPDVSELQRRFEITGFPSLVVAGPDGRLIRKMEGYRGREALVEFLDQPGGGAP